LLADSTFVLDVGRARSVLGWRPRHSNVGMTLEAYDWYARHWQRHQPRHGPVLRLLNALS
jgi:nucleoside-diphosphate-sugar epimerase